jgi:non-ribosomal peptide synthetase component E (peptide arylation enzyme)
MGKFGASRFQDMETRFSDDPENVNGTIGRPVRAMELRIVDSEGNDVPNGEIGELMSRGPSIHLGYHKNSDANRQAVNSEGWFRTGDLGRVVDTDGNVHTKAGPPGRRL